MSSNKWNYSNNNSLADIRENYSNAGHAELAKHDSIVMSGNGGIQPQSNNDTSVNNSWFGWGRQSSHNAPASAVAAGNPTSAVSAGNPTSAGAAATPSFTTGPVNSPVCRRKHDHRDGGCEYDDTEEVKLTLYDNYNTVEYVFYSIINKSNVILLVWFIALYVVTYFTMGLFFNNGDNTANFTLQLSRMLDIIFLLGCILFIISSYCTYNDDQKINFLNDVYSNIMLFIINPLSIYSTVLFILAFYIVVYLFQMPMSLDTKPVFISMIENFTWVVLLIIVIIHFFENFLGISIIDMLDDMNLITPNIPECPDDNEFGEYEGGAVATSAGVIATAGGAVATGVIATTGGAVATGVAGVAGVAGAFVRAAGVSARDASTPVLMVPGWPGNPCAGCARRRCPSQ